MKLRVADGKMRLTDVADTEQLFRIIQSIPSPKAKPFKRWMAQVASIRKRKERIKKKLPADFCDIIFGGKGWWEVVWYTHNYTLIFDFVYQNNTFSNYLVRISFYWREVVNMEKRCILVDI